MKDVHIGSIIRDKIKEKGITIKDFAKALHCNRSNVYSIFERKYIDFQLLKTISEILEHDLLTEYIEYNSAPKFLLLIEIDNLKMKEIQADSTIIIHFSNECIKK